MHRPGRMSRMADWPLLLSADPLSILPASSLLLSVPLAAALAADSFELLALPPAAAQSPPLHPRLLLAELLSLDPAAALPPSPQSRLLLVLCVLLLLLAVPA